MAPANVSENSSQKPRDLIARILMIVGAIGSVQSTTPVAAMAEVWRICGLREVR